MCHHGASFLEDPDVDLCLSRPCVSLPRPAVAGVILGRRLGLTDHRAENAALFTLTLDAEDLARIDLVASKSHDLFRSIGDCGDEYR
jgi:hypothetical protein